MLGWDGISILKGEKVSFDSYVGFMVWWVCVKVNFACFDNVIPIMATLCEIWEMICYVDVMSFVALKENYVKWHIMLRNVCHDMVEAC